MSAGTALAGQPAYDVFRESFPPEARSFLATILGPPRRHIDTVSLDLGLKSEACTLARDQGEALNAALTANTPEKGDPMQLIQVVEPHPLLRLGLLQLLSGLTTDYLLEGADYASISDTSTPHRGECALLLLSIATFENLHHLIPGARRAFSPKSILLLSDSEKMPQWAQALPPPVSGYVPRHAKPEILQAAVRLLLAGGTCFPLPLPVPDSKRQTYSDAGSGSAHASLSSTHRPVPAESEMLGLTPRQYEVLVLLARGYPIKKVSHQLNISVATAKAHTETLYQRLDVHNRNAAVYAAVARGASLGWLSIATALEHAQHPPSDNDPPSSPSPGDKIGARQPRPERHTGAKKPDDAE